VPHTVPELKSLILWTIGAVIVSVAIVWALFLARDVLLLIYVSSLLAIGFTPMVRLIERQSVLPIGSKRFPRWLAILVLYSSIIGFVALVGYLVFPPLVHQAQTLARDLPDMFERGQQFLINRGILKEHLTLSEAVASAPTRGGTAVGAVGFVAVAVGNVAGGVIGVVTILILSFYLLVEADTLRTSFLRLFPRARRARVEAASHEVTLKVSAWLGGQLLLGSIIGTTSAIGLWALGVPFFYVLALISGIGELIPVVGPILAAIPALAIASTISAKKVLFVLIFFFLQQQFENHVLVPRVMSRQVGVSAVTVIIALLIGGELLGILGAILAVPSAAILQVVAGELVRDRE
jgi:predicted PurR-regulated permease PerM